MVHLVAAWYGPPRKNSPHQAARNEPRQQLPNDSRFRIEWRPAKRRLLELNELVVSRPSPSSVPSSKTDLCAAAPIIGLGEGAFLTIRSAHIRCICACRHVCDGRETYLRVHGRCVEEEQLGGEFDNPKHICNLYIRPSTTGKRFAQKSR